MLNLDVPSLIWTALFRWQNLFTVPRQTYNIIHALFQVRTWLQSPFLQIKCSPRILLHRYPSASMRSLNNILFMQYRPVISFQVMLPLRFPHSWRPNSAQLFTKVIQLLFTSKCSEYEAQLRTNLNMKIRTWIRSSIHIASGTINLTAIQYETKYAALFIIAFFSKYSNCSAVFESLSAVTQNLAFIRHSHLFQCYACAQRLHYFPTNNLSPFSTIKAQVKASPGFPRTVELSE